MKNKYSANTLQEDLNSLGIGGLSEDVMASVALGVPLAEKACARDMDDEEDDDEEDEDGEDYEESKHDPMDGPFVTHTLFDRIMALPFERLDEEDIERVIEGLKTKRIPRNIPGIQERAEEVASDLLERVKTIIKAGKRARINVSNSPEAKKLRRERRLTYKKKKTKINRRARITARKAPGKRAALKTAMAHQRMGDSQSFAVELEHILHEHEERDMGVRDEILIRLNRIIDLVAEEFNDEAVVEVFEEAVESLSASYAAGRLDEDVMDADAFLTELRPIMALVSKSLDRLDTVGSGNC